MPASVRNSVVLPAPLVPTSPSRSPLASENVTSRRAATTTRCLASLAMRPETLEITVFFRLRALPWYSGKSRLTPRTSISAPIALHPERDAAAHAGEQEPRQGTQQHRIHQRRDHV